jgi:hypothetical protein
VDFLLASGKTSRKVFKLAAKDIAAGQVLALSKSHSFRQISTRRYYPGGHALAILVNGVEMGKAAFKLKI